ncbi:hypothetical protein ACFFFR_09950 [Micrococcoides hystricis]|uniref:Uncharacterized protein n=1 Tax=Micrococcoides hystricis TaxID=1572761 RepID=A0ABV6PDH5_9MICC
MAGDENFWTATYKQDFAIVEQMVQLLGLDHEFLRQPSQGPVEADLAPLLSLNRVGSRHGYWVVQTLLKYFEPDEAVHIRGNFIESLRGAAAVNHAESDMNNLLGIINHLQRKAFAVSREIRQEDRERLAMEKLDEFGYFDLPASWERTSLFYAEARTPQWHAEMANEQDVVFDTYLPHNNRRIYELFWATPMADRRDGIVVKDLVNATSPLLNFFPVNDEETLYESWRKHMTEGVQRTKLIDDWLPPIGDRDLISSQPLRRVTLKGELPEKTFILHNGGFHIPAAALAKAGRMESQEFLVPAGANVAEFVLRLPYSNEAGAGRVRFDVHLNNAVVASFDPALTPMMSLIRIENLEAGDRLRYVLSSTVQREAVSWRRATLSQVSQLNFLAEGLDEPVAPKLRFQRSRVPAQLTVRPLSGTS